MQNEIKYDEVFDAQEHYRLLLDSMSRPGKINVIPALEINEPMDINNASALIAFALLNTDASFCSIEDEGTVGTFIALHTSALITDLENADLVFVQGSYEEEFVSKLKAGTLSYPENSATIVADVTRISDKKINNSIALTLEGPGVDGTAIVYITGLNTDILDALKEQGAEFPLGIDLILTDGGNCVVCIPRSNDLTYLHI